MDGKPVIYRVQAGFRESLSPDFALIINSFFRSQKDLPDNLEFNAKALLMNKIWNGAGHRRDYASNLQFGFLMNKVRLGYIYESPITKSYLLPGQTHEFTAVFQLFGNNDNETSKGILIW